MKMTRKFTLLVIVSLAWALAGSSALAMPAGASAPVGDLAGQDNLIKSLRARKTGVPDNLVVPKEVLRIDGTVYSGQFLVEYITEILEGRVATDNDLAKNVTDLAVDIVGADVALREMPSLSGDAAVQHAVAKLKSRFLPDVYYIEEIRKKVNPTIDEIAAGLPDPPPMYEILAIINPDESKIDEARKAVLAGDDFGAAARKYSDGLTAEKGGKVGAVTDGKFDLFSEAEFRLLRNLKEGELSIPFLTRIGWAIVKMEKFWTPEMLKRNEAERNFANYKLEAEKREYEKRIEEVRSRSKFEWNEEGLAGIKAALDNNLPITEDLKRTVIFRIDGTPYFAYDIDGLTRLHSKGTVDVYLDKRARMEIISREAERLGYAGAISGLADVAGRRAVTRRYFAIRSRDFKPTEKDLRAHYAENPGKFAVEEARRFLVIDTADRKKADEAARKARKGQDFAKLAGKYNDLEENRKKKGDILGFLPKGNIQPDVAGEAFSAKQGAVLGPFELRGKEGKKAYVVMKLAEVREASVRPYDSINWGVVEGRLLASRMEEFYKGFFHEVGKERKIEFLIDTQGGRGI